MSQFEIHICTQCKKPMEVLCGITLKEYICTDCRRLLPYYWMTRHYERTRRRIVLTPPVIQEVVKPKLDIAPNSTKPKLSDRYKDVIDYLHSNKRKM
jgi:hypothetical protein